jgi:lysophospholipase L1-like esterase
MYANPKSNSLTIKQWQGVLLTWLFASSLALAQDSKDTEMREWTSKVGTNITAQFVKILNGKVILKKADGTTVGAPLPALSASDQELAKKLDKARTSVSLMKLGPGEIVGMPDTPITSQNDPTKPVPGGVRWFGRDHQKRMDLTKAGGFELVMLGDSVTDGWWQHGGLWNKYFGKYKPANFGIGGDRTENVLWRLNAGELVGTNPKVVVVMLGTNNAGFNTPGEIAVGIGTVLKKLRTILPETKIVLLGIFPRKDAENRAKTEAANKLFGKMHDGNYVHYHDISSAFMDKDGKIKDGLLADDVHLTAAGYAAWGEAMTPILKKLWP